MRWFVIPCVAILVACGGGSKGGSQTTTPPPTPGGSSGGSSLTTQSGWIDEGVLLTSVSAGFPGTILADITTFPLNDGRWRHIFEAGGAFRSAVSADGLTFQMEAGARLPSGGPSGPIHPRVFRLEDGRLRMFYSAGRVPDEGIYSAVSSDEGVTFTLEPGVRLSAAAAGYERIGGIDIIRLPDGRWRLYTSDRGTQPIPGQPFPTQTIVSATSSDMLTWTMDPGVRIGAGATVSGSAAHPSAIVNNDGTVSLFYHRFTPGSSGGLTSTSPDGLSFTSEAYIHRRTDQTFGDPDAVLLPDGSLRVYFGTGDERGGDINSIRRAASTAARIGQINLTAAAARTNDGARIRALADDVLDLAPVTIPRNHSLRERLARAEENFRLGSHHTLSEATVVEAMNAMAAAAGFPAYTDVQRFRTYRRSLQSLTPNLRATTLRTTGNGTDMSPVEAVALSLALVNSNLESGDPGVTWQAYRLWLERSLTDEESQASTTAHDLLSLAGIRR